MSGSPRLHLHLLHLLLLQVLLIVLLLLHLLLLHHLLLLELLLLHHLLLLKQLLLLELCLVSLSLRSWLGNGHCRLRCRLCLSSFCRFCRVRRLGIVLGRSLCLSSRFVLPRRCRLSCRRGCRCSGGCFCRRRGGCRRRCRLVSWRLLKLLLLLWLRHLDDWAIWLVKLLGKLKDPASRAQPTCMRR